MSSKQVTMHGRRICAIGPGVLLLLSGWLPAATGSPPDPPQSTRFLKRMPAATDWYSTCSLRQPDRRCGAGSALDSRTDQRGRRQMRPGELLTTGGS